MPAGIGGSDSLIFDAVEEAGQYKILLKCLRQETPNCGLIYFSKMAL